MRDGPLVPDNLSARQYVRQTVCLPDTVGKLGSAQQGNLCPTG